jgi:hypothetical protein
MRFGVSYFGVRDPRHVRRDLDEIAEAGFAAVTHTFSEHDLRFHVEDVGRIVEETRDRGLESALDPWGVAGLFGGEAYSELALTDLSARQVDAAGDSLPVCCPNAEATRGLIHRWARTAAGLGADVLFWDEPHFYLGAFRAAKPRPACRCAACRATWRETSGEAELPPEGTAELTSFRTASLARLLEGGIAAVRDSGVRHSLCLLPRFDYAGGGTDDWSAFEALEGIARLGTDPYWMDRPVDPGAYVSERGRPLVEIARRAGREAEIWIQGIRIPAGRESAIRSAVLAAAKLEPDLVSFWSFRATERMSSLSCGDPEAAWREMKEAVDRHAGKPGAEPAR